MPETCKSCGTTVQERVLGMQMVDMLAGASERAKAEAKPDDPVRLLRRLAAEFGYELVRHERSVDGDDKPLNYCSACFMDWPCEGWRDLPAAT